MKKNTFKVMFVIRRNQVNRDGKCSITIRITVNGEYERLNFHSEHRAGAVGFKSGQSNRSHSEDSRQRIEEIRYVLQDHYYEFQKTHGYVTAEMVKNAYMGITAKAESLMPIYDEFLAETKKMVGINRSDKTYQKYERCKRRVVEFMKVKYNRTDILLRELKPKFLTDFAVFLASTYKCRHNTVYKFLQLLRMVIIKAQRDGISFPDPYLSYKMTQEKVDRGYLSEEEVLSIATKDISIPRLDQGYNINHNLKTIAGMVGVTIPLTLYVARHSWASAAKANGILLSVISEGMGHDNETTTQIYLASLDTSVVDKANSLILKSLK